MEAAWPVIGRRVGKAALLADIYGDFRRFARRARPRCNPDPHRAMLPEHTTSEPFRNPERLPDMLDASTTAGLSSFPEPASRRISFSSVRLKTAFRSRSLDSCSRTDGEPPAQSFSSFFRRFIWFVFRPPNYLRHQ